MKEIIKKHIRDSSSFGYKAINAVAVGMIIYIFSLFFQVSMRQTSDYFHYESVNPTREVYALTGEITFLSTIERYQTTDMRYNDTLFCGWNEENMFWYSQVRGEYNNAPAGKFISEWRYDGEIPTTAMICKIKSAPYVKLPFGMETDPQFLETKIFTIK